MIFIITILVAVSIMAAGTFAWLSLVQRITNDFEYEPEEIELAPLYISKSISDKAFDGKAYAITADDENLAFEFTVTIGKAGETYRYTIYDKNGDMVPDYQGINSEDDPIVATSGTTADFTVKGTGTITIGDEDNNKIWLRHGDVAVIENIPVHTYYEVSEKDYYKIEYLPGFDPADPDFDPDKHDFACNHPEEPHSLHFATASGWARGDCFDTSGNIRSVQNDNLPSTAKYENVKVTDDFEVTISSLVVVDRIIAHTEDIDHKKFFEVNIEIGNDPLQQYYYGIAHIEETIPAIEGYDHEYDYYLPNDPTPEYGKNMDGRPWPQFVRPPGVLENVPSIVRTANPPASSTLSISSVLSAVSKNPIIASIASRLSYGVPGSFAAVYKRPIHEPHPNERWPLKDGTYQPLKISENGNKIKVNLHHASAIIVYGIPVGTPYKVWQVDYANIDGYMIDCTYKTEGSIQPDLFRVEDHELHENGDPYGYYTHISTPAQRAKMAAQGAGARTFSVDDPKQDLLLRTRADIYNHFVRTVDITISKGWENVPAGVAIPSSVNILLKDQNTGGNYFRSVKLEPFSNWTKTIQMPTHDANGKEIKYGVEELNVPNGYTPSVDRTDDPSAGTIDFTITNTYDDTTTPDPGGSGGGSGSLTGEADLTVTKTVNGNGADRYKKFDFTVKIGRYTYRIKLSHGQRYVFTDIPAGTAYSVSEASYSSEGYSTSATGTSGTIKSGGNTAAFVNTKGAVTQSSPGTLTITKSVSGWFVDTTRKFRFVAQIGGTKHEVFLKHGESSTFVGIPAGTAYTVTEDDYSSAGYVTSSTGATGTVGAAGATAAFVNEYVGEAWPKPDDGAVQISGKKTWVHGENTSRPESITVFVMNGSTIVAQKTVTAKEDWKYAFNLPKYGKDGKEIIYSINEDTVKDYFKTIKGYDLENVYNPTQNPGTGDMKVIWIWFIAMMAASIGLRAAVFYRKQRKGKA